MPKLPSKPSKPISTVRATRHLSEPKQFVPMSFAEFPPVHGEHPETAYRRGYRDGFIVAASDLTVSEKEWRRAQDFYYDDLAAWEDLAHPPLIEGTDGRLHWDSWHEIKRQEPPRASLSKKRKTELRDDHPSRVIVDGPTVLIKDAYSRGVHYEFALDRIDTPIKLLGWAHHLAKKPWMRTTDIHDLIVVICGVFGWDDDDFYAA